VVVNTQGGRCVSLGVQVNHENGATKASESASNVHRCGGLPDAALLIGNGKDAWRGGFRSLCPRQSCATFTEISQFCGKGGGAVKLRLIHPGIPSDVSRETCVVVTPL
jgi:hypothetical protein